MAFTITKEQPKGWMSQKIEVSGANETEAQSRLSAWEVYGHRNGVKVFRWYPTGTKEDRTPRYIEDTPIPAMDRAAFAREEAKRKERERQAAERLAREKAKCTS